VIGGGRKRGRGAGFGRGDDIPNHRIDLLVDFVFIVVLVVFVATGIFLGTILGLVAGDFGSDNIDEMFHSNLRTVLRGLLASANKANRHGSVGVFQSSGIGSGE
jgi:hypothetical protein